MKKASAITQKQFDTLLAEIVEENTAFVLFIPGVYEILSEHYNNEVLERFENS